MTEKIIIKDRDIINLIKYWKNKLGLKRKVTWIKDYEVYKCIVPDSKRDKIAAEVEDDCDVMWIDIEYHLDKSMSELINSIIHELLHLKHGPEMTEIQVRRETECILNNCGIYEI